jgi:phenylalanyl-tRNA synthetase beta chain
VVALANPLAEDQSSLRRSLLGGLLANLRTNTHQQRRDIALFEMGRVFAPAEGLPVEERRLALLLAGRGRPGHWSEPRGRTADVFDMKGALEVLFRRLGLADVDLAGQEGLPSHLHPGQGALVRVAGEVIGSYGLLHPEVSAALDRRDETIVAELGLEVLLERPAASVRFEALDRFPAVERDLSIVCDAWQPAAALQAVVRRSGGERLRSVAVVDRYDRPPVPAGRVSLTVSLRFQDRSRTLSGEEVQAAVESVVRALKSVGAEVRSE